MSCPLDIYPNEIENVDPHNIYNMLMEPPSLSISVESNSEDETPGIQLNDGPSQTQPLVRRENSTSYGNEDFFPPFHEIITPHMSPKKMPNTALESLSNNHPTSVIPVSAAEQENSPDAPHTGNKSSNASVRYFSSSKAPVACAASETPKDANSNEEGSYPRSCLPSETNWTSDGPLKTSSYADKVLKDFIDDSALDDTFRDGSDTDYVDESAIDDEDDSSDWEDSIEVFQRVDSQVNLTSRRSLLTLMIDQQSDRDRAGNHRHQSTPALPWTRTSHPAPPTLAVSPNDSDDAPLMMNRGNQSSHPELTTEAPRSAPQPIPVTASHSHLQAVLTPRTTRRNMLATEFTESLRQNLLWERQQVSSTANAVLKRCPTALDVANLAQYPEKVYLNKNENIIEAHQYSCEYNPNGYHSKGW